MNTSSAEMTKEKACPAMMEVGGWVVTNSWVAGPAAMVACCVVAEPTAASDRVRVGVPAVVSA